MIGPAHREQQVKAFAPQIDVELVGHHRPGHLDIGNEENVLVRCPLESNPVQFAHRAVRTVASCDPRGREFADRTVRGLEAGPDLTGILREADEFRVPLHGRAAIPQSIAEQTFVVILAKDQEKGIRAQIAPDVAQRNARCAPPLNPQIRARGALAEVERRLDDAELRIDLQSARLYAQRACLQ